MIEHASERQTSFLLFLAAAFWGLYWWPLREMENAGMSASWAVALFNAGPLIVLGGFVLWNRKTQFRHLRTVMIVAPLLGLGLGFYATGLVLSSVIRVTMLFYLTPIWSTLIGVFWLSEKLTLGRIVAIVLGLGGLLLLLSGGDGTGNPLNLGDLFGFLSGIVWGFGAAGMKRWPDGPTAITTAVQLAVTMLFCALLGFYVLHEPVPDLAVVVQVLPVTLGASLLVLLPSLYIIFAAAKRLFPGRVGVLMMSEVLVAITSASLLLPHETMSLLQWGGGALIIGACFVEIFIERNNAA